MSNRFYNMIPKKVIKKVIMNLLVLIIKGLLITIISMVVFIVGLLIYAFVPDKNEFGLISSLGIFLLPYGLTEVRKYQSIYVGLKNEDIEVMTRILTYEHKKELLKHKFKIDMTYERLCGIVDIDKDSYSLCTIYYVITEEHPKPLVIYITDRKEV